MASTFMRWALPSAPVTSSSRPTIWILRDWMPARRPVLAMLYYRVPGFPIGFGDKAKARQLLEQRRQACPKWLDAWYFYGDFLYTQNEFRRPPQPFNTPLKIQPSGSSTLGQEGRLVIEELLAKIESKSEIRRVRVWNGM